MRLQLRRNVDLPHPDGPISDVTMPRRIARSTSCRAWNEPYQRLRSTASIASSRADAGLAKAALQVVAGARVAHVAGEQILARRDLDAAAAEEERRAAAQPPRLLHEVGDQHDRQLAPQFLEHLF